MLQYPETNSSFQGLPTKGFPLVFHGVNGQEEREAKSPSWFNTHEVMQVIEYVKLLMDCKSPRVRPRDIGIISPYHQQVCVCSNGLYHQQVCVCSNGLYHQEVCVCFNGLCHQQVCVCSDGLYSQSTQLSSLNGVWLGTYVHVLLHTAVIWQNTAIQKNFNLHVFMKS